MTKEAKGKINPTRTSIWNTDKQENQIITWNKCLIVTP